MACCDTQKNIKTYTGASGLIPFCKKCGKSGASIPKSTAKAALDAAQEQS